MARPERFELPTTKFVAWYSIQLSYGRVNPKLWVSPGGSSSAASRSSFAPCDPRAGSGAFRLPDAAVRMMPNLTLVRQLARACLILALPALLAACDDGERQRVAAEAAAARQESMAAELLRQLEASERDGRPDLARAFAEDLVLRFPQTAAGKSAATRIEALRTAADAEAEARRLRGLWTYHDVEEPKSGGRVRTAYLHGVPASEGLPPLRLVLRRHPEWGQSAYVLVNGGDFACRSDDCRATLIVDDAAPRAVHVSRAQGADPPALFIEKDAEFLAALDAAKTLSLVMPLADGREARYAFEVGGFEIEQLGPPIGAK